MRLASDFSIRYSAADFAGLGGGILRDGRKAQRHRAERRRQDRERIEDEKNRFKKAHKENLEKDPKNFLRASRDTTVPNSSYAGFETGFEIGFETGFDTFLRFFCNFRNRNRNRNHRN